jgi:hypothetical protein
MSNTRAECKHCHVELAENYNGTCPNCGRSGKLFKVHLVENLSTTDSILVSGTISLIMHVSIWKRLLSLLSYLWKIATTLYALSQMFDKVLTVFHHVLGRLHINRQDF